MEPGRIRRILIVKLSALGDVAHALPVVDYLGKRAPGSAVDWVVDRRFAGLLEGHPGLRRVIPLDLKTWKSGWTSREVRREAGDAVRLLRAGGYDAAFDIQGNTKSGVVTWLSGAPLRFGFARNGVRESPNLLFTNRKVPLRGEDRHIGRKYLRVVSAPFGGTFDPGEFRATVATSPEDDERAAATLRELAPGASHVVSVHPGTTWETKRMDASFWAGAIRLLREAYPSLGVLLSWGDEAERREAERIRDLAAGGVALLPPLSLKGIAAVYRRCGYLMAPDTGPLHIAAAVGARTVSVFRATDGSRNAPHGPTHRFLQAPMPCTACLRKRCDRDAECRESVRPEDVATTMASLIDVPERNGRESPRSPGGVS
ncbi:MAG TPA: lipopolysaccharide heptosyltransferase I [Deltaproteobacteria bacterium]|nr:lipopolysaccharide heptosyltransferase I [Deltaproteobacteria bacterium]